MDAAEERLSAAVLDVNLDGEMSHAAAERLIARQVPIVFATGYDAASRLPVHLRAVPTLQKPVDTAVLVQMLAALTAETRDQKASARPRQSPRPRSGRGPQHSRSADVAG